MSYLANQMEKLPQVLINTRVKHKNSWQNNTAIQQIIRQAEERLGKRGRILVRPSGTEPLIRVMAEGNDLSELEEITRGIAQVIEQELN